MTDPSLDLPAILAGHLKWGRSDPGGSRADLSGANLYGAYLSGADLSCAYLSGADLSGAYLSRTNLSGADLSCTNLSGADLSCTNLSGANLSGANLSGANLSGTKVAKGSKWASVFPIGDADRICSAVIAQPDENHRKPFLWLMCGCFRGDEKAYKARVAERYKKGTAHYKQCMAALVALRAIAGTWEIES
jgi:hypothetical protein